MPTCNFREGGVFAVSDINQNKPGRRLAEAHNEGIKLLRAT